MKNGISLLSIVPLRKESSHKSELVSQLLFGETYEVLSEQQHWLEIRCAYDGYEGWIDKKQHTGISSKDFLSINSNQAGLSLELVSNVASGYLSVPVVCGSTLPFYDGMSLKIGKEKFIYNGQALQHSAKNAGMVERVALRYLNAPYLWGGRSPFGIDCSGFTQVVFKSAAISLLRDAYQQAEQGVLVNFIEEALAGDLAFFSDDAGRIVHVGIILKENRIIHSSGKVRMDKIDHFGIYNEETKKYTHQLKLIKRVL